jgi:hypothetical protein
MSESLVAAGPPPLTVEAADCALDVIDFIAAAVRGVDSSDITPAVRDAWRSYLASYYPLLERPDRYWFVTAPWTLATIRAAWPEMPEKERNLYRREWAEALPGMLQFIDPALYRAGLAQAGSVSFGARAVESMQTYFLAQPEYPASSGHDSISDLVTQIHARQKQAEIEALEKGLEAHLQMKLLNDATNAAMLSNMSQMRYRTSMAIIRNIKH